MDKPKDKTTQPTQPTQPSRPADRPDPQKPIRPQGDIDNPGKQPPPPKP